MSAGSISQQAVLRRQEADVQVGAMRAGPTAINVAEKLTQSSFTTSLRTGCQLSQIRTERAAHRSSSSAHIVKRSGRIAPASWATLAPRGGCVCIVSGAQKRTSNDGRTEEEPLVHFGASLISWKVEMKLRRAAAALFRIPSCHPCLSPGRRARTTVST